MSDADTGLPSLAADPELLAGFFDESRDQLQGIADQLVAIEVHPDNRQGVEAIFRAAHSIKGNSAFFGFMKAKHLAHRLENVLDVIRKGRLVPDRESISVLLTGFDQLQAIFERLRNGQPELVDVPGFEVQLTSLDEQEARAGGASAGAPDWGTIRKDLSAAEK